MTPELIKFKMSAPTGYLLRLSSLTFRNFVHRELLSVQGSKVIAACQRTVSSERKAPWNLGKLNHVAIAVPDLDKATDMYKNVLGAKVSEPMPLPEHGVRVVFIELGNTKLELLHPLGENSPIEGFLKKQPDGGMHHICIEVDDIQEAIKTMQANKVRPLNPEPKIGAHGKPVTFLHPKDCGGVLIELEEA